MVSNDVTENTRDSLRKIHRLVIPSRFHRRGFSLYLLYLHGYSWRTTLTRYLSGGHHEMSQPLAQTTRNFRAYISSISSYINGDGEDMNPPESPTDKRNQSRRISALPIVSRNDQRSTPTSDRSGEEFDSFATHSGASVGVLCPVLSRVRNASWGPRQRNKILTLSGAPMRCVFTVITHSSHLAAYILIQNLRK